MNLCGEPLCGPLWTHKTLGSQDCFFKVFFKMFFFKMPPPRREGNTQKNIVFFAASFFPVDLCDSLWWTCCLVLLRAGGENHSKKNNLETQGPCGSTEAHKEVHHRGSQRSTGKKLAAKNNPIFLFERSLSGGGEAS